MRQGAEEWKGSVHGVLTDGQKWTFLCLQGRKLLVGRQFDTIDKAEMGSM